MEKDELFEVFCVGCNKQSFTFSKNMLEESGDLFFSCPKCGATTQVSFSMDGISIKKAKL
jgi:transcription initiation factor IIE alpha subunit